MPRQGIAALDSIPKTAQSREEDDELPLFCGAMFTLGPFGGVLHVPILALTGLFAPPTNFGGRDGFRPDMIAATQTRGGLLC